MNKYLSMMFAVLIVVGVGFGVFSFLNWIYNQILSLDPRISAALVTGVFVIVGTTLSITIPNHIQKKKGIEEQHRELKVPMYQEFLEFLFRVFMGAKMGKQLSQKDTVQMMSKFTQDLILWGSKDVITRYREYREHFLHREVGQSVTKEEMKLLENLLLEIRKDMGHKNKEIKEGDILSLFINDIEKYFPKENESAS